VPFAPRTPDLEIDHVQDATDALPMALRTPLTLAIVQVFAARWQAVWDAQRVMLRALDLTDSFCEDHPWALRAWGDVLRVIWRTAWSAAVYRRVLLAAVIARRSTGSREDVLAVVQALTPTGAAPPQVSAAPLTVWVHAPGITDAVVQEALRPLLLAAIPDVADLELSFADEQALQFDTEGLGFDGGEFS
jgi:hypothetical protein